MAEVGGIGDFEGEGEAVAGVVEEADADVEEGSGVVAAGRFFVADVDVFKIMEAKEGV